MCGLLIEDAKTPSEAKKEEQKKEEGSGMIELPMEDSNAEGTQEEDDRPEAKVGGDTDPNYHRKVLPNLLKWIEQERKKYLLRCMSDISWNMILKIFGCPLIPGSPDFSVSSESNLGR